MVRALVISLVVVGCIVLPVGGLIASAHINAWEQANGYPYGRLCDAFRSCR
jgi:hypothetical protein